jgi:hypothetical protein
MVNAISAKFPFTGGNSIVLYQNPLPERYSVALPFLEVAREEKSESHFETHQIHEILYYDRLGQPNHQHRKGLFINTYF